MGWGYLFFGYFLAFILGQNAMLAVLSTLPGCLFMTWGIKRLSLYCRTFHYALWSAALVVAVSVGRLVLAMLTPLSEAAEEGATLAAWLRHAAELGMQGWLGFAEIVVLVLFHAALAFGIKDIAMRVGVQKNAARALRNLVLVGLYAVGTVLSRTVDGLPLAVGAISVLLGLIWSIAGGVLLYSCYMRIAPAEQTEPVRRPSRFGWVNRVRDAYEQKTQRAIDADRAYHEQKSRERWEKQRLRMSKKQQQKQDLHDRRNGK